MRRWRNRTTKKNRKEIVDHISRCDFIYKFHKKDSRIFFFFFVSRVKQFLYVLPHLIPLYVKNDYYIQFSWKISFYDMKMFSPYIYKSTSLWCHTITTALQRRIHLFIISRKFSFYPNNPPTTGKKPPQKHILNYWTQNRNISLYIYVQTKRNFQIINHNSEHIYL